MKALIYEGPQHLRYADMADPVAGEHDSLIRIEAVGICGSDMHAYLGHDSRRPAPLVLGHEVCGTVLSGGPVGKRVTVNPLVNCMQCEHCKAGQTNLCSQRQIISMPPREGGFAQLVAVPQRNVTVVPDGFDPARASLTEPIACGWHAIRRAQQVLDRPIEEARCCILGGGAIGVGAALVLAAQGVRDIWIAETNPLRHDILRRAGPFTVFNPLNESGPPDEPHLVIDGYGGQATRKAASAMVRAGGVIVHIGLAEPEGGLDIRRMTLQEITFIGTYTYTVDDFAQTVRALVEGRLGNLDWIEERPLEQGAQAFSDIYAGRLAAPKIVLIPNGGD